MSAPPKFPSVIALCVTGPSNTQAAFQLRSDHSVFIGTSANCGLPLKGEGIADIHCYVRFEDDQLWVEDWMSKSGTLVNGAPITERVEVHLGDVIQVGSNQIALQSAAPSPPSSAQKTASAFAKASGGDEAEFESRFITCASDMAFDPPEAHAIYPRGELKSVDAPLSWPHSHGSVDRFNADAFDADQDETYNQETVALLRAEIEHLQAALAQRDAEHQAELAALHKRLAQAGQVQERLSQVAEEPQRALREDRVRLAEAQKQVAKLKPERSSKRSTLATSAEPENRSDTNADQRIQALRDHLRQIHEQEQQATHAASLAGRLKRLWQRSDG